MIKMTVPYRKLPSHIEKQPRLSRAIGLRQHEPHAATYRSGLRVEKAYMSATC